MAKYQIVSVSVPGATLPGVGVPHTIRHHHGDGTATEIVAPSGKLQVGDVFECDEERACRHLRADPRFKEIDPNTKTNLPAAKLAGKK